MPPAADIQVNGVAGSDDDVPINTLVQLSNADLGGEITYFWELVDQPTGTAVALSSATIENPTFTPTKEGSYLLRLTVNDGLATEVSDTVIVAVRDLKTNERIPAALETIEVDTSKGWKPAVNRILDLAIDGKTDGNVCVCLLPAASVPTYGDIVYILAETTIKTGLPGEERLFSVALALATTEAKVKGELGIVIATPTGAAPAASGLCLVRKFGLVEFTEAGAPAVGDPVYVSDTAQPALAAGTISRQIGKVVSVSGGNYRWVIDSTIAYLPRIRALESSTTSLGTLHTHLARQQFTANGTYTPTSGTKRVIVRMVGGGGGGGGAGVSGGGQGTCAGGGASGVMLEFTKTTNPIVGGAVVIGAGGAGGADATGGTGGDTTITIDGNTYTAKGGLGGQSGGNNLAPVSVTLGGALQAGSSAGDYNAGAPGGMGVLGGNVGGSISVGGNGGSNPLGAGGRGGEAQAGSAGSGYGAGGGGGATWQDASARDGAAGTAGTVIIDEYT